MNLRKKDLEQQFLSAYDSWAPGIFRHCLLRVSSRPLAEELTQETFLKTWEYLRSGERVKNLKAFLYRVATNLITDHYRRQASVVPDFSLDRLLEEGNDPPSSFDDILRYESRELLEEVEGVLSGLKREYREIILLRHVEELEAEEIAEVMEISVGTVYVRLHRAIRSLRKHLADPSTALRADAEPAHSAKKEESELALKILAKR